MFNLVGNAIKFTEKGSVTVKAWSRSGLGDDRRLLVFSVADSGPGIPEDRIGEMFQAFSQLDGSLTRDKGGTGLGLAIVKRLVGMMGGSLAVDTAPGQGTEIFFTIAAGWDDVADHLARHPAGEHPEERFGAGRSILVVEDEAVNRLVLRRSLEKMGFVVECADNGLAALDMFRSLNVAVVLMDIRMPEMDGIETIRRLRDMAASSGKGGIPVIALTAYAMHGDRERLLDTGFDDYLAKPVDIHELAVALRRHLGDGGA